MFKPVSNKTDFPALERDITAQWEQGRTFEKSLERPSDLPPYVFYDGPPFATGLPHYGHLLAGTIKDIVPRYQTMRGRNVERRFGWDCHGLPIEALAQEALGINGAQEINAYGVAAFNEQCRAMVLRYVDEWRRTVTRMGRWVDFDNDYKTMDASFMESIWWVFKQLWDKRRIYKSYRIMPYSWKLNTPLSNFEAGSNYKDVQDPSITVRTEITDGHPSEWGRSYLLVWTTTPWTLPSNLAICVGPQIEYVVIRDKKDDVVYVLAQERLEAYYKSEDDYTVIKSLKGNDMAGWRYEPIFPYFSERDAFRVLVDDFVTIADGTGLVHMAPAYGEDDFRVCRSAGIDIVDPLDNDCRFTKEVPEHEGVFCKDADRELIRALRRSEKLVHQSTIVHSYPFCDRTDTPLIYRAIEAWYVKVEDIRDKLVAANEEITWMPEYVGDRRFGNWLREARDWNISRNRFWGSCLPLWINENDPDDIICIGSVAELEDLSGVEVKDLHKHFIDEITIEKNGKLYRRTPEVLDCWFESGAMPYAQQHYPFGNDQDLEQFFPADFIAEGLDQTRGWFYTLLVLGVQLFGRAPFRNVVVNGLVLAEDGKKMSKRLKNYPDPLEVLDAYGADALRLYMIYSPVVRAENLRFSEGGVRQLMRDILIPWWNAYAFFVTYANVDGWHERELVRPSSDNELDRWIVSSLETLVNDVSTAMDRYDLQNAVRPFVQFIDDLTNWYIRRSRRRFWKSRNDGDKRDAYQTLRYVLVQLCKVAAPFTPFISEAIYRNLKGASMPESVHLCDFPEPDLDARDSDLEKRMALVQTVVRLGRQLRIENDLKIRQPLERLHIVSSNSTILSELRTGEHLINDELNIRHIAYDDDELALVTMESKADFRRLGPRVGRDMKQVAAAISAFTTDDIRNLMNGENITVAAGETSLEISLEDVVLQRIPREGVVVSTEGELIVALETALTPELISEGLAREFISRVQNLRKEADFEVTQRIAIAFSSLPEVAEAITAHHDMIASETLALSCEAREELDGVALDLNGRECVIKLTPLSIQNS